MTASGRMNTNFRPRSVAVLAVSLLVVSFATVGIAGSRDVNKGLASGAADPVTCQNGTYNSGTTLYLICVPSTWNGDLVVYAHGYVSVFEPLAIVDDMVDGTPISDIITSLGYAFATTSYRFNGLVIPEAVEDIIGLVNLFPSVAPSYPRHVYLVGASEGGLVTALAVEKYPVVFTGGLATCGPCGDFEKQINYFGDFLVVFNYFFPKVLPDSTPESIPPYVISGWDTTYAPDVLAAIQSNPEATQQLLRVTGASIDPTNPASVAETVEGLLEYNVFATDDAVNKLGGSPYDNRLRWYSGSDNDVLLNRMIPRFGASNTALAEIEQNFQTSGHLKRPLVTIHTTGDPIIPYWQESIYSLKVLLAGSLLEHFNIPITRYGHCTFTQTELLDAFSVLVFMAGL